MISLEDNFSFITEKGPILVAVSGGSDSMALLLLANAWARLTHREIHAVTVDHGLRPEAAAEAAFVAMVCDGLDIVHTTLAWEGIKPPTGISAAARDARYGLIDEFARDIGVRLVLSGHTRDDQAETLMMRLQRSQPNINASGRGLSGMCRRTYLGGGALLLRPLLNLSRQQLRDYLQDTSQSWIEDPSNHDESYERVRVRGRLAGDLEMKNRLVQYSNVMGRLRAVVARDSVALLEACCTCERGHLFQLDMAKLSAAPQRVAEMAIKAVIAVAGGASFLVSERKLLPVISLVLKKQSGRVTVGNCVIESDGARLRIYREARNLEAALVEGGEVLLWDGRVWVSNEGQEAVRIEAMPGDYIDTCLASDDTVFNQVRKAVLMSSPLVTTASGQSTPVFFNRPDLQANLPPQLEIRTAARALEYFCPEWEFCLIDWLKSIDLAYDQNLSNIGGANRS